jgi:hypothetical protein
LQLIPTTYKLLATFHKHYEVNNVAAGSALLDDNDEPLSDDDDLNDDD